MTAIIGGLGAAALWAASTLCSSRSSRMLGSRVVLAWVMVVGVIVGMPVAILSPAPAEITPLAVGLLLLTGVCYAVGLNLTYAALTVGKVSVVAPIVATEGGIAALIAVALGDTIGVMAGLMLLIVAGGVVLASLEPARPEVPAGGLDITADALEGPALPVDAGALAASDADPRRAAILAIAAAFVFGVGLVATGKAAGYVPVAWVAVAARLVGIVVVTLPVMAQRRFRVTRQALPLVLIAGTGEVFGSMLSAWGSRESIAITAVLGSQFAAIAAVAAFVLFGERLSRTQIIGVVLIVAGVTALAVVTA